MSANVAEARETIRADIAEVTAVHGVAQLDTDGNCPACHVFWPCAPIRVAWWLTRLLEVRTS